MLSYQIKRERIQNLTNIQMKEQTSDSLATYLMLSADTPWPLSSQRYNALRCKCYNVTCTNSQIKRQTNIERKTLPKILLSNIFCQHRFKISGLLSNMSEVLKFYLEWLSVKKRDWTRELPASIGLGTWPSAEPVSCLSYFLDAQDSVIWVAHASEAIPRPALKVSNHVALCFLMGSQLSFKVTKVQLVHIKLNSIGLTKVRNKIVWLRGWWGQSIGNCLRGGCCQKPQWVVGIDGGAIEDADCRTFLAQTIPPWLLCLGPRISTRCYQLPSKTHPTFDISIKLRKLLQVIQEKKNLSLGCSERHIKIETWHRNDVRIWGNQSKNTLVQSFLINLLQNPNDGKISTYLELLGHSIAGCQLSWLGNCSSLQKVQSMPCCHALVQGHADAEERRIVEGEQGISGTLDSLDTWNACLSWLHWGMQREMCQRFRPIPH